MSYDFTLERRFDASPTDVFDALTSPARQREWWGEPGTVVRASGDVVDGGRARVEWGPDADNLMRADQQYIEVDRPRRLVYTEVVIEPGAPVYECRLTITLEDVDGQTLLTLLHTGFPTSEERDKHERGTGSFVDRLERFICGVRSER